MCQVQQVHVMSKVECQCCKKMMVPKVITNQIRMTGTDFLATDEPGR
jgi:hypothetical protein